MSTVCTQKMENPISHRIALLTVWTPSKVSKRSPHLLQKLSRLQRDWVWALIVNNRLPASAATPAAPIYRTRWISQQSLPQTMTANWPPPALSPTKAPIVEWRPRCPSCKRMSGRSSPPRSCAGAIASRRRRPCSNSWRSRWRPSPRKPRLSDLAKVRDLFCWLRVLVFHSFIISGYILETNSDL